MLLPFTHWHKFHPPFSWCLTQIKLTTMHCVKAFQVEMVQVYLITKKPNDSLQLLSLVILVLHPYLFWRQLIFCSPNFITAKLIGLCDWNFLKWGAVWLLFPSNFLSWVFRVAEQSLGLMLQPLCGWCTGHESTPGWHPSHVSHRDACFLPACRSILSTLFKPKDHILVKAFILGDEPFRCLFPSLWRSRKIAKLCLMIQCNG